MKAKRKWTVPLAVVDLLYFGEGFQVAGHPRVMVPEGPRSGQGDVLYPRRGPEGYCEVHAMSTGDDEPAFLGCEYVPPTPTRKERLRRLVTGAFHEP